MGSFNPEQTPLLHYHCSYLFSTLEEQLVENQNLKILDAGCGSGKIAIELAKGASPHGEVVGVDHLGAVLVTAATLAEGSGVNNIQFVKADLYELPFNTGAFDVVHVHQVLAHLTEPIRAVKELLRVTRKGGALCMREGILDSVRFAPPCPTLDECFRYVRIVHKNSGGSTTAGCDLGKWARKAGARKGNVTSQLRVAICNTTDGRKDYGQHWPARCLRGVFADALLSHGVTS